MGHSIPEILKDINSRLSWFDCFSLLASALIFLLLSIFLYRERQHAKLPVLYRDAPHVLGATIDARAFGSVHGTTYTYSWCSGASQIKETNKIFFSSAQEAESAGRTLSKLCQK